MHLIELGLDLPIVSRAVSLLLVEHLENVLLLFVLQHESIDELSCLGARQLLTTFFLLGVLMELLHGQRELLLLVSPR